MKLRQDKMFMLCKSVKPDSIKELTESHRWFFQVKIDGVRAIYKKGLFINRRKRNITDKFPEIQIGDKDVILDGEIADNSGNNFNKILMRNLNDREKIMVRMKEIPCLYFVFDILELDGNNLRKLPLKQRKKLLENWYEKNKEQLKNVKLLEWFGGGNRLWKLVEKEDREGIIAKHEESIYESTRSPFWLKIKRFFEEVVIFNGYQIMKSNKGIILINDKLRCSCLGHQAEQVKKLIDDRGYVRANVQHLGKSKEGMLRQLSYRSLVK